MKGENGEGLLEVRRLPNILRSAEHRTDKERKRLREDMCAFQPWERKVTNSIHPFQLVWQTTSVSAVAPWDSGLAMKDFQSAGAGETFSHQSEISDGLSFSL